MHFSYALAYACAVQVCSERTGPGSDDFCDCGEFWHSLRGHVLTNHLDFDARKWLQVCTAVFHACVLTVACCWLLCAVRAVQDFHNRRAPPPCACNAASAVTAAAAAGATTPAAIEAGADAAAATAADDSALDIAADTAADDCATDTAADDWGRASSPLPSGMSDKEAAERRRDIARVAATVGTAAAAEEAEEAEEAAPTAEELSYIATVEGVSFIAEETAAEEPAEEVAAEEVKFMFTTPSTPPVTEDENKDSSDEDEEQSSDSDEDDKLLAEVGIAITAHQQKKKLEAATKAGQIFIGLQPLSATAPGAGMPVAMAVAMPNGTAVTATDAVAKATATAIATGTVATTPTAAADTKAAAPPAPTPTAAADTTAAPTLTPDLFDIQHVLSVVLADAGETSGSCVSYIHVASDMSPTIWLHPRTYMPPRTIATCNRDRGRSAFWLNSGKRSLLPAMTSQTNPSSSSPVPAMKVEVIPTYFSHLKGTEFFRARPTGEHHTITWELYLGAMIHGGAGTKGTCHAAGNYYSLSEGPAAPSYYLAAVLRMKSTDGDAFADADDHGKLVFGRSLRGLVVKVRGGALTCGCACACTHRAISLLCLQVERHAVAQVLGISSARDKVALCRFPSVSIVPLLHLALQVSPGSVVAKGNFRSLLELHTWLKVTTHTPGNWLASIAVMTQCLLCLFVGRGASADGGVLSFAGPHRLHAQQGPAAREASEEGG